jgi:hypothetical protein
MATALAQLLDERLGRGRSYVTKAEAVDALGSSATAFNAAAARLVRRRQLARPKHGFFVILRPEDRASGGPDPARWIDPLMRHIGVDYRVSLLRAAAFLGVERDLCLAGGMTGRLFASPAGGRVPEAGTCLAWRILLTDKP